jgi:hypothetical protein
VMISRLGNWEIFITLINQTIGFVNSTRKRLMGLLGVFQRPCSQENDLKD